ncbi:MAG: XRE family transcriptional regulator [Alphaproteobacteria bacterium]|nr:MAG: XRE family transcriptional regulator [Alphaproteobacteria bacterium]
MPRAWVTSDEYDVVVQALVGERTKRGVSQRELADRLRKPRSFVSKLETKERRVDLVEFIAIARALGAAPSDLFTEIERGLPPALSI